MQQVFFELLKEYESAEDWANMNSLKELRDRVLKRLGGHLVPSPEAVCVALEGRPLPLDALVRGDHFSDLIAQVAFLNTGLGGETEAVPEPLMYGLLEYARQGGVLDEVGSCITLMTEHEEAAVLAANDSRKLNVNGGLFEMFIACWLQLRLRVANKPVTIREILHLPQTTYPKPSPAFDRTIPDRDIYVINRPKDSLSTLLASAPQVLDVSEDNKIVLLGNSPAFNIVAVLQDDKKQRVALFFETRSAAAGTTIEGLQDQVEINDKLALFDDAAKQALEASRLGVRMSDIVHVSVLHHNAKHNNADKHKHFLKENVVLLGKDNVRKVLTPILADRARFLRNLQLE